MISRRFGRVIAGRGGQGIAGREIDELRRFKIFAELDVSELETISQIVYVQQFPAGEQVMTEGADADRLYLFQEGKAAVKVLSPEGQQVLIDEVARVSCSAGAVMETPYIRVRMDDRAVGAWWCPGDRLRELCEANERLGYQVIRVWRGHVQGSDRPSRATESLSSINQDLRRPHLAELDSIARVAHIQEFER